MGDKCYIAIDGTCLLFQIIELQRKKIIPIQSKLNLEKYTTLLRKMWEIDVGNTLRVVYYFKEKDERLNKFVMIPDFRNPGMKNKLQIEECGIRIKSIPDEYLLKIPSKYRDIFPRGEKGLDIKLTCDALTSIFTGKISSVVLFVNDRDYLPLFKSIQSLGANVYLSSLHSKILIRKELLNMVDKYLTTDDQLNFIFDLSESENKLQKL